MDPFLCLPDIVYVTTLFHIVLLSSTTCELFQDLVVDLVKIQDDSCEMLIITAQRNLRGTQQTESLSLEK